MSDVTLTLKVQDKVTAEAQRVMSRFGTLMKGVTVASAKFTSTFDARAAMGPIRFFGKLIQLVGQVGNKLNELAPNARQFSAVFTEKEAQSLERGAEAFNKMGAAWDKFVGTAMAKYPQIAAFFDEITRRMDSVSQNATDAQSNVTRAVAEMNKAQEAMAQIPESQRENPNVYYKKMVDGLKMWVEQTTLAYEAAAAAESKYNAETKQLLELNDILAQRSRDESVAGAINEMAAAFQAIEDMEIAVSWDEIADAWDRAGASIEWVNRGLLEQAARNATVAETLRDMKTLLREWAEEENSFIDDMWDEINAREQKALDDADAIYAEMGEAWQGLLDKEAAQHADWADKIRAQQEALARELDMYAGVLTDNVMGFFDAIMTGSDKAGAAFGRMIAGMLADVGRLLMQKQLMSLFSGLLGGAFGQTGDGVGDTSAARSAGPLQRASGGSMRAGQPHMVGERGPELFIPNQSGNMVTAGRSGGGGIGNVTINVSGAKDPRATAREIKQTLLGLMQSDPSFRQVMRQGATA